MRPPPSNRPPLPVVLLAGAATAMFVLPLIALAARAGTGVWSDLTGEVAREALLLSLVTSVAATLVCILLGLPLAWVLARVDFPGRRLVRAIVTLPMVLPPVVAGAALLFAFGRRGTFGGPLYDAVGFVLPFSIWGVIVANAFVAMPFLVVTVEGAIRGLDESYEEAAAAFGASPWRTFTRVVLPMIGPSLGAGVVLAWARALGEFGATVTFAGNLPERTQTLPLAVYVELERDRGAAVSISLVLVLVSLVVLVALRDRWWTR